MLQKLLICLHLRLYFWPRTKGSTILFFNCPFDKFYNRTATGSSGRWWSHWSAADGDRRTGQVHGQGWAVGDYEEEEDARGGGCWGGCWCWWWCWGLSLPAVSFQFVFRCGINRKALERGVRVEQEGNLLAPEALHCIGKRCQLSFCHQEGSRGQGWKKWNTMLQFLDKQCPTGLKLRAEQMIQVKILVLIIFWHSY